MLGLAALKRGIVNSTFNMFISCPHKYMVCEQRYMAYSKIICMCVIPYTLLWH